MARWCWVNFQCRGVLLIWYRVGQGPTALAVGAGGGCLDIFSLIFHFSFLSPYLWETARYRLKYCLKGPLRPNQPTNQILHSGFNTDSHELNPLYTSGSGDSCTGICWSSPFVILGVSGLFCRFYSIFDGKSC